MHDRKSVVVVSVLMTFALVTSPAALAGKSPMAPTSREHYEPDEAMEKFTTDLTTPDTRPFLGRVDDIGKIMERLISPDQKGVLVKSPPGTGKTSLVKEVARLLKAKHPDAEVRSMSVGGLISGASILGDAEARAMPLLEWASAKPNRFLVIDEAHMLTDVPQFTENAKEKLSRGEVSIIAMTTDKEYATSGLKDNQAFQERFYPVDLKPYSSNEVIEIMMANRDRLEAHYKLDVQLPAIEAIVGHLERMYPGNIPLRGAMDIMNGVMARAHLERENGTISENVLKDKAVRREALREQVKKDLVKYSARGEAGLALQVQTQAKIAELDAEIEELYREIGEEKMSQDVLAKSAELAEMDHKYQKAVSDHDVTSIMMLAEDRTQLARELADLQKVKLEKVDLSAVKHWDIDRQRVADYILSSSGVRSDWIGKTIEERMEKIRQIFDKNVKGQKFAKEQMLAGIEDHFTQISPPEGPGFMLLLDGATGSGKSELVRALALSLSGSKDGQVKVDMNTMHQHSAMRLAGAGPGLVGYEQGGVFDEFLRKPGSILHLEELDKASPEALKMFYQIFDTGLFTDARNNVIDFRNRFIIASGNFTNEYALIKHKSNRDIERALKFEPFSLEMLDGPARDSRVLELTLLQRGWPPAMIGRFAKRLVVEPMTHQIAIEVVKNKLQDFAEHWKKMFGWNVKFDDKLAEDITTRYFNPLEGARSAIQGTKDTLTAFGRERLREISKLSPTYFEILAKIGFENREQVPKIFPTAGDQVEVVVRDIQVAEESPGVKLTEPIDVSLMQMRMNDKPVLEPMLLGRALEARSEAAPLAEAVGEAGVERAPHVALGAKQPRLRKGRAAFQQIESSNRTPHK